MFVDEVNVKLKAGDGGAGCVSFRRLRHLPKGGPDGGDGGKGGDVILVCDENVGDLINYKYKPHAKAENGQGGKGNDKNGKGGPDCLLPVPPGTVILGKESGEVVTELMDHGQRVILLKGGKGGKGNLNYKTSINRAPRKATPGVLGEDGVFKFVLKTIADVGLVGFPNAGKSTLVGLITRARPKTAPYPFTTLHPNVGVVDYPEHYSRLLLADIPGLVAGAHANKGLGHRFLRHIERCRVLLLIVDMAGVDARAPVEDYEQLLRELELFNPEFLNKPRLVAANKMDLEAASENVENFQKRHPQVKFLPISCLENTGIEDLKNEMFQSIQEL